jgi:hypothetical protein
MARLCRAADDLALVRKSIEEHTNPERLRVLKLAEEQERDLLDGVWVAMARKRSADNRPARSGSASHRRDPWFGG